MTRDESSSSGMEKLRNRMASLRNRVKRLIPFVSGVGSMLLALILYNFLFPGTQLTRTEVNDAIANAMASATPRPAYSAEVFKIIQPSLVLIQVFLHVRLVLSSAKDLILLRLLS